MKQLSKYYRRFTDLFPQGMMKLKKIRKYNSIFSWIFTLYLFIVLIAFGITIWQMYVISQNVEEKYKKELKVMEYWKGVVREHPNYPDAYFQLAKQEARLRYTERALNHLEKALLLDPLFEEAKLLQDEIIKKGKITQP